MADTAKYVHIKIEAQEYTDMKKVCDDLKKRMDEANSDVAYQGYKRAWNILSEYYDRATKEIRSLEKAEAAKQSREKRRTHTKQAQK